jgi:hypothetical protein
MFLAYDFCNYETVRKSQYDIHLFTAKHKILTNTADKVPNEISFNKISFR